MTELERRALMGDREAQEECTRRGIVLTCPRCGKTGAKTQYVTGDFWYECPHCHSASGFHSSSDVALSDWNTRSAPPVGRCGECEHWADWGACGRPENGWDAPKMNADDFCSRFEPKGDEENA